MSQKKLPEAQKEWLMLVYQEAWRQYNHEDQLAEQRDSKHLTILSLIFTAVGVVISMVLSYLTSQETLTSANMVYALVIGLILLAMTVLILGITATIIFCLV